MDALPGALSSHSRDRVAQAARVNACSAGSRCLLARTTAPALATPLL
ncbi:hypothetical protein EV189_1236 [Motilibacter rhizosphaerae]|uniref:Uncharacterized protein n=1 Tax=Motilibacter rhizosphaerae TaxID=598652 RepID=A0A4V2F4I8_9ACTN|nr:hypothetical protein [Motilibacter rhizosphaerae]RZS89469.1 hypothetical protein EV189_1236 [Motilibacter rhizosphaerae]